MMKIALRIFIFAGLFGLILVLLSVPFVPNQIESYSSQARTQEFYNLPPNSIDVLYMGASTYLQGIMPLEMWYYNGHTGFVRATSGQPPIVSYYYLSESLKYQRPSVVVLDTAYLLQGFDYVEEEGRLRGSIDSMRLSLEKIEMVYTIVKKDPSQSGINYFFPLFRYHSRWGELTQQDFADQNENSTINKGYYGIRFVVKDEDALPGDSLMEELPMQGFSADSLAFFQKTLQLCQKNGIEVLFLTMPRKDWSTDKHLIVQNLANENNARYLDYNLPELMQAIDLDVDQDFFDYKHLNTLGAQKISKHLGAWLWETYHLPDRRSDPTYTQWDIDYQRYRQSFEQEFAKYQENRK
jgi:hypothetical protein